MGGLKRIGTAIAVALALTGCSAAGIHMTPSVSVGPQVTGASLAITNAAGLP